MTYDKKKCPIPGKEIEWEDFCDWINHEGIYKENRPMFCKNTFFITDDSPAPDIEMSRTPDVRDFFHDAEFYRCECSTEGIEIVSDEETELGSSKKIFYFTLWKYGRDSYQRNFWERLKLAFKLLKGERMEADSIVLNLEETKRMRNYLDRKISDGESVVKLKEKLRLLNEAIEINGTYDQGYENGQRAMMEYLKQYFEDKIEGRVRSGISQVSALLDSYFHKLTKNDSKIKRS